MAKPPTQRTVYSAATNGNVARLRACIKAGLDLGKPNGDDQTALYLASCFLKLDAMRLILDAVGPENAVADAARNPAHNPLVRASAAGPIAPQPEQIPVMEALIEAGFDVNGADEGGRTPLAAACEFPQFEKTHPLICRLIELGADVGAVLPDLEARWNAEIRYGHISDRGKETFKSLLKRLREAAGVDGQVLRPEDRLTDAVARYDAAEVGRLLTEGAEQSALDQALSVAVRLDEPDLEEDAIALVERLLAAGASPNADHDAVPVLGTAAQRGRVEALAALLAAGADVNRADDYGRTPLIFASEKGDLAAVQALLAAGADPEPGSEIGTAFDNARAAGSREIMDLLLKAGATGTDWGGLRGIAGHEYEEHISLVRAAPEAVAEVLAERRPELRAVRASEEAPVELGRYAIIVYRFAGNEWSIVEQLIGSAELGDGGIAIDLSRRFDGVTLEYSNSDTADFCQLVEYESGQEVGRYASSGPHRVQGDWTRVFNAKFVEHGAYAPGIRFRKRTGDTVRGVLDLPPEQATVWVVTQ